MGKLVNIVLPGGRVVSVPEEDAAAGSRPQETLDEGAARAAGDLRESEHSGALSTIGAGLEGVADTVSFGGYGKALGAFGGDEVQRDYRERAGEHGGARFVGEVAGVLAPTGWLGATAKGASAVTGVGLAAEVGAEIGGTAGRLVEGGILGAGGKVAETNITGDQLTVESLVESATVGGILNVGAGALGDRIERATWGAKIGAAKQQIADEALEKGGAFFKDPPPSWNEFVESRVAAGKAIKQYNDEVAKEAKKFEAFLGNDAKMYDSLQEARDMLNAIKNERYAKPGGFAEGTPKKVAYSMNEAGEVTSLENTFERGKVNYQFTGEGKGRVEIPGREGGARATAGEDAYVSRVAHEVDTRPVMSAKMAEDLKLYESRYSDILKLREGGWVRNGRGHWIRDTSALPDRAKYLEEVRAFRGDLKQHFPELSGEYLRTQLPTPPRTPMKEMVGELPKSVDQFARKHAEQIAEIGTNIDPASASALERVMKDLDLQIKGGPAENLAALHETLRGYRGQLVKFAEEEAKRPAFLSWLKRGVQRGVGRFFDAGGIFGAVKRVAAGEVAAKAMTGAEDAVLGGTVFAARVSLRDRLRNLVANYGVPTSELARKLAPVTAYLGGNFIDGTPDSTPDLRQRAVNRINDIHAAAASAPDAAYMAVQPLMGHPGDLAWKTHQHVVGTLQHLVSVMPRDPGLNTTMFDSKWTPQWHEAVALAHRLEAVQDPLTAIARSISGDGHPAATETLWAVYPAMMNELSQEIAVAAPSLKHLTYEQASAYSQLFRTPLTALQQPVVVSTIQGLYLPKAPPAPSAGGGSQPPGRPAKVQSRVAGSSVDALTTQ